MKKFLVIMILSLSSTAFATNLDLEFKPILAVGHRFGNGDINNKGAFYLTVKMSTLKMEVDDFKTISFMSIGINYQDDKKWAPSISPISISSLNGMTFGIDYIPTAVNVNGGAIGMFFGVRIP